MKKILSIAIVVIILLSISPMFTFGAFNGFIRILVAPSLVFDNVYTFRDGIAWVQRDGKVGFVNRYGEIVIPMEFDSISHFFCEGLARVGRRVNNNEWIYGFIDKTGELVIDFQFTWAGCFHDGVAVARKGDMVGVIDTTGQAIIPFIYTSLNSNWDWGRPYTNGLVVARLGDWQTGVSGVLDREGNTVIPFEFASISLGSGGSMIATIRDGENRRTGMLNQDGEVIVPFEYNWIGMFREGLAPVNKNNQVGFINEAGELVIPMIDGHVSIRGDDPRWMARWAHHGEFEDGFAVISKAVWDGLERWDSNYLGLIDTEGNVILPFEFDMINSFSEGLATVGIGEAINIDEYGWFGDLIYTFGVIDKSGNFVIPMGEFDSIGVFRDGIAIARRDGQTGAINRYGNVVIPFEYSWIRDFTNGLSVAQKDGKSAVIDSAGNVLIPFGMFDHITTISNDRILVTQNGKRGAIDLEGNIIEPFVYSSIHRVNDYVRIARKGAWNSLPIDFIDSDAQLIYSLPDDVRMITHWHSSEQQNGGLFWIATGDRETGINYGILEISTEPTPQPIVETMQYIPTFATIQHDTHDNEEENPPCLMIGFVVIAVGGFIFYTKLV
ncbi:MAG: WG repeat-containing protein [Defluviitaleaceae bacterium]|nr:WG repeat-containing protein [Defluviitaleaceae bacterium]